MFTDFPKHEKRDERKGVRSYFKLEDAIAELSHRPDASSAHIFAFEISLGGRRKFMIETKFNFWMIYRNLTQSQKKHYEVLRRGMLHIANIKSHNINSSHVIRASCEVILRSGIHEKM